MNLISSHLQKLAITNNNMKYYYETIKKIEKLKATGLYIRFVYTKENTIFHSHFVFHPFEFNIVCYGIY